MPILEHLGQGFLSGMSVSSEYASAEGLGDGEFVRADMIDELAEKHWPMCMRHLHDCLRKDRHLKHYGRLQYGLFLKVRYTSHGSHRLLLNATRWSAYQLKKPLYSGERHSVGESRTTNLTKNINTTFATPLVLKENERTTRRSSERNIIFGSCLLLNAEY